jgi:hypothetical protein
MITKTTLLFIESFFEIQLSWIPKAGSQNKNNLNPQGAFARFQISSG